MDGCMTGGRNGAKSKTRRNSSNGGGIKKLQKEMFSHVFLPQESSPDAKQSFSWDSYVTEYIKLYNKYLADKVRRLNHKEILLNFDQRRMKVNLHATTEP